MKARLACGPARPAISVWLLLFCLALQSCAGRVQHQRQLNAAWLAMQQRQATQVQPCPQAGFLARRILEQEQDSRERLGLALALLVSEFAYDPDYARRQFTRSACELFDSRILGGCSDYALAGLELFRAMGHPCMLVVTVSSKWLDRLQDNPLAVGYGHSFIEVMVDGQWLLADPNHFVLYGNYDPADPFYPHKEIFMARGYDFQDLGLHSTEDARRMLQRQAGRQHPPYRSPSMKKALEAELDLPALFVNLGDILAGENDFLALKRYTRALDFDPDHVPAYLGRGKLHLQLGNCSQALHDFNRALELAPENVMARRLRAQAVHALGLDDKKSSHKQRTAGPAPTRDVRAETLPAAPCSPGQEPEEQ